LSDRTGIAFDLDRFALVAAAQGQAERCLWLAGAAGALRERASIAPSPVAQAQMEAQLAPVREQLGEAIAAAAQATGRALSLDEAMTLALSYLRADEAGGH